MCLLVNFGFHKESRGRYILASAYDAKGGSQFRAILQLLRQIYSSLQRPYGSIDGLTTEVLAKEVTMTPVCLKAFEILELWLISAPLFFPTGGQLGRDVHRSYICFKCGDCISHIARPRRRPSTNLLHGA
jgi:hypothetical protein